MAVDSVGKSLVCIVKPSFHKVPSTGLGVEATPTVGAIAAFLSVDDTLVRCPRKGLASLVVSVGDP